MFLENYNILFKPQNKASILRINTYWEMGAIWFSLSGTPTQTHTHTLAETLRMSYIHHSLKPWVFWHGFLKDKNRPSLTEPWALPRRTLAVNLLTCSSAFSHCPNAVSYGLYVLFKLALKILLMAFSCIVWKGFLVFVDLPFFFFSSYRVG